MTETNPPQISLRDRYTATITNLVERILGGKQIISKEYIHRVLGEQIVPGTSEILEGCLQEQLQFVTNQLTAASEIKQAKLGHQIKSLQMIGTVLTQWQQERQASERVTTISRQLIAAEPATRLQMLFQAIDRNQTQPLQAEQLRQIVVTLRQQQDNTPLEPEQIGQLATGLENGLTTLAVLEEHLVSWIYDQGQQVGFGSAQDDSPWLLWAKYISNPATRKLFTTIGHQQSVAEFATQQSASYADDWVQMAIILQGLQIGLVAWFDRQMYDLKWGERSSFNTLITFSLIWCELANGVGTSTSQRAALSQACWQITWQILRIAAQRPDFPLYGGIFATFSGDTLRDALAYFDQPLKQVAGTQEKGRVLTMLGYSQQVLGQMSRSIDLHKEALSIASAAGDKSCEVANFNHLSRIYLRQQDYKTAIDYSQRALILARQAGDRRGEANALINYGYSEVLAAQARAETAQEVYEQNISYLQQGLQLAEKLRDSQSLALCYYSLGIAYLTLQDPAEAIGYLAQGIEAAQTIHDLYLRGLGVTYLAEAYYQQQDYAATMFYAGAGMFTLHQIGAKEWQQAASILHKLEQELGVGEMMLLPPERLIELLGSAGYDSLPGLLAIYRRSIE
jgi:tetratricopeptide (TPR) repeat protein